MKDNNNYWAGRVRFFLSHTPPGVDVSGVFIAHVNWYNHLPQGQNMSAALSSIVERLEHLVPSVRRLIVLFPFIVCCNN